MNDLAELFAKARDADIEAVTGIKLTRAGRRLRGECPVCGSSKGARKGEGAFSVDPQARIWFCFGSCNRGGDVIDLEQQLRGGSVREAAERLAGAPMPSIPIVRRSEPRRVEGEKPMSGPERLAREIFVGCRPEPIARTPAAAYLRGRGIGDQVLRELGPGGLFFNPSAKWGWDEDQGRWTLAPAIVAQVRTPAGRTGGVHVTYLAADCSAKAALTPAKRMWGPQRSAEGVAGGVWLTLPKGPGPLIVGEGIESTLSAMALHDGPCRAVATLSLNALQGGLLTDKWGRLDPSCVAADPERPAFTWPDQDQVLVAVDRDMKPIRCKARKLGGGTVEIELGAEDRARICAGLAVQAWRVAGAKTVRAIAPAAGRDFNDELRERVG